MERPLLECRRRYRNDLAHRDTIRKGMCMTNGPVNLLTIVQESGQQKRRRISALSSKRRFKVGTALKRPRNFGRKYRFGWAIRGLQSSAATNGMNISNVYLMRT